MALKANYEFLFVGRDDNSFLENYSYDLFQEHGDKSGQIFINLEVQNNQVDAEEIGRVIFESMQAKFFEDVERDPYERFEVALRAVNDALNVFKKEKASGYIGNLNVIIAAILGDVLYLTQSGDAEAYLIRKRYVSVVSEGLSDESSESGDIFGSIASGKIEAGDFVMFSSTRLLRYVSKTDLAKCVNRKSIMESLNELREVISTEILGRVGLTGIMFDTATTEDLQEIEAESDSKNRSLLESYAAETVKEKESLTGKFFTAFKSWKGKSKASESRESRVFSSFGEKFESFGDKMKSYWEGLFSGGFGKDKVLALLILVIIILVVGIWIARDNMATRSEIEKLDKVLLTVQDKITEAETKGAYDKENAKIILDQAYLDALSVLNSGYYREKAKLYLIQIESARDKIDNVQRIDQPKVFIDLAKKRSDVNALGFAEVKGRNFVYEYNALYEIVLNQLQDPLTIDEKETVISATGFDDRNSVVFMTKSGKLIEFKDGTVSFMDTDDGAFHKGVAITSWGSRVYVLDPSTNQVWRYAYKGIQEKFAAAEGYFVEKLDLSKAQDLTIDSNVYVLSSDGDISKYYSGTKAKFYINNPPFGNFEDPRIIYTNEKLNDIYVLDSKGDRIFVYAKDSTTGNLDYKTQYLLETTEELRDMYVDADARKMYVLTPTKVLEVDIAL
ncbi:MAG: hypothetical protein WC285_06020 [Candidatus Gracilibacteria bacterium]|jgi:hypothetical protein